MKKRQTLSPSISIAFNNITDLVGRGGLSSFGRLRLFTKRVDRILTMDTMIAALDMYTNQREIESILYSKDLEDYDR